MKAATRDVRVLARERLQALRANALAAPARDTQYEIDEFSELGSATPAPFTNRRRLTITG